MSECARLALRRFFVHVIAALCMHENNLRRERTAKGLAAARAKRQEQGLPPIDEPAAAPAPKRKPKPAAPQGPTSRKDMAALMKRLQDANPDGDAPKTQSAMRYGISRASPSKRATTAQPAPRPAAPVAPAALAAPTARNLLRVVTAPPPWRSARHLSLAFAQAASRRAHRAAPPGTWL